MKKQRDINNEIKNMLKEYNYYKENGNKDATNKIFKDIMILTEPLILYIINQMVYKNPITKDDLKEICYIRLWEIIDKYEENEKIQFSYYLVTDLRYTMINYIREEQNMITIPHNIMETNSKINRAKALNKDLSIFTEKQLENYEKTAHINEKATYTEDDWEDSNNNIEKIIDDTNWDNERLTEIYKNLSSKEKDLLNAIVFEELSYSEYGRRIGKTRETIRLRFNKLQEKIKKKIEME